MKVCTIAGREEKIKSEAEIKAFADSLGVQWIVCRGLYLFDNRNTCIEYADGDDVLFVDSDIVPTIEAYDRLIKSGKDIISGAYLQREKSCYCRDVPLSTKGIISVPSCGAGFLYIKAQVFKAFSDKFYFWNYKEDIGEDIGFCKRATELGFTVHIDCDSRVTHVL